ncbi:MAG: hypothetical protein ACLU4J_07110 [Butyricimonas paravirosa]
MKTRIFVLFISILAWVGCDRREIPTYNTGNHYIEFERATTDSTIFTFIYHPNNGYCELPIAVRLREMKPGGWTYSIAVDEEFTTAESKTLPDAGDHDISTRNVP